MKKFKVSFTFDELLNYYDVMQRLIKIYQKCEEFDVYIITRREQKFSNIGLNDDIFTFAKDNGIDFDNIIFTEGEAKFPILDELEIDLHYESIKSELKDINKASIRKYGQKKGLLATYFGQVIPPNKL